MWKGHSLAFGSAAPIGGGTVKQHPSLQARQYKGMILSFNQDISAAGIRVHPAAYLFNLYRRSPEPLEDARYQSLLSESKLFLASDNAELKAYLERLVPRKAKNDVLFLLEHGKWKPADELISRVGDMLEGNEGGVHFPRRAGRGLPRHPAPGPVRDGSR